MTLVVIVVVVLIVVLTSALRKSPTTKELSLQNARSFAFSEITDDLRFDHVRSIRTKIRGVSKNNYDGSSRQRIIDVLCHEGDALYLVRESNNPVDSNAVQVRRVVCVEPDKPRIGEQLGYLSRELAEDLAPLLDGGVVMIARILNVTGTEAGYTEGVNIQIEEYALKPPSTAPSKKGTHHRKTVVDRRSNEPFH